VNPADLLRRAARRRHKDPYAGLPTDEFEEPILPRWFVVVALLSVPVAMVVFVVAFFGFGRGETPVVERRPPPGEGLTSDVGDLVVGDREPVPHDPACPEVEGYRVAGTDLDRGLLGAGLDALCEAPGDVRAVVEAFAAAQPALRFAAFEATGVDVTGSADGATVLVNARFSQTPPQTIAPLVAYQAVVVLGDPAEAATIVAARDAELAVCESVVEAPSRPCDDAAALLALDDPRAALVDAGFR
jgi:hypothetical protein